MTEFRVVSVMDDRTCVHCAERNGMVLDSSDPRFEDLVQPRNECKNEKEKFGGCRCVLEEI